MQTSLLRKLTFFTTTAVFCALGVVIGYFFYGKLMLPSTVFELLDEWSGGASKKKRVLSEDNGPDKICFFCKKITTGKGQITFSLKGKDLLVADMICYVNSIKRTPPRTRDKMSRNDGICDAACINHARRPKMKPSQTENKGRAGETPSSARPPKL